VRIFALWLSLFAPIALCAADIQIVTEDELLAAIDQEAAAYLDQYQSVLSQEDLNVLQKSHKVVKQKLSELGYFKAMLKRYGKSAAIGALGLELTMDTSLPLTFLWLKMPVAAAAVTLVPWSAMGGAGGVAWQKYRERRLLQNAVGTNNLKVLDELRASILQYEGREQIMDLMVTNLGEADDIQLSVVKKLKSRNGSAVVSLEELEKLITQEGEAGAKFLLYAKDFKSNLTLYTAKLIHYVAASAPLSAQLIQLFSTELATGPEHLREYADPFHQIEALRTRFERETSELIFFQGELKQKLKGASTELKNQGKAYGKETAALLKTAREMQLTLQKMVYGLLLKINAESGPYPTSAEIILALDAIKEQEASFLQKLALFRIPLDSENWRALLPQRAWDLNLVNVIPCGEFYSRLIR
jgi:hypothetical protein